MKLEEVAVILMIALVFVVLGLLVWARVAAPCDWIDWLPVKDVPARCLLP